MNINPYLHFNGNCEAAFTFYETVLSGKTVMKMRYRDAPMPTDPASAEKIMHITLAIGDTVLMGSDAPDDRVQPIGGFTVSIGLNDPDEAARVFASLAEGGATTMPLQKTFWSRAFGMTTDRYGTPWMINCE